MIDEPEIVKEMREAENLRRLSSKSKSISQESLQEFEHSGERLKNDLERNAESFEYRKEIDTYNGESKELCQILVENLLEGILILDFKGRVLFANPAMAKMFALKSVEECIGKNVLNFVDPKYRKRVIRDQFLVRIGKGGFLDTYRAITADGRKIWIEGLGTKIKYKGRTANVVFIRDITERKLAEEALQESEENYRRVVENAAEGVTVIQDGKLLFVNPKAVEFSGRSREELLSQPFIKFVYPDDRDMVMKYHVKRLEGEKPPETYSFRITDREGDIKWLETNGVRIIWNEKPATLNFITDITIRKKAEEELNRFYYGVEQSSSMIIITDKEGFIEYVNSKFTQLSGYTSEEAIGKQAIELTGLSSRENKVSWEKTISGNEWRGEFQGKKKNGKTYWVLGSITPIKTSQGVITHYIWINDDISDRKQAENVLLEAMEELETTWEEIKQQNIQLKKLNRVKSDFLNIASHELRTPMSAIKGYSQMILNQTLGEITKEQKKALNIVLRNMNRLDNLVQGILDISGLKSGTMKFIPKQTNLGKMLDELVETMQSSADLKDIKINANIEDNLPELSIDQERIKQVIINLVNNAMKFSPDGSIINTRVKKDRDNVLFEVQDFGRGIPGHEQNKIFDAFYQVDSGMDRKFGGVGLGLAVSRGIVIAHGGKIWTESTVGKGSTFRFTLPVKAVQDVEGRFKEVDIFGWKSS